MGAPVGHAPQPTASLRSAPIQARLAGGCSGVRPQSSVCLCLRVGDEISPGGVGVWGGAARPVVVVRNLSGEHRQSEHRPAGRPGPPTSPASPTPPSRPGPRRAPSGTGRHALPQPRGPDLPEPSRHHHGAVHADGLNPIKKFTSDPRTQHVCPRAGKHAPEHGPRSAADAPSRSLSWAAVTSFRTYT